MSVRNLNPVYICDRCHNERDSKMKKIAGMDICDCCEKELLNTLNTFFSNGKEVYDDPCDSCSYTAGRRCEQCTYGWIPIEERLKRYNRVKGRIEKLSDIIKFKEA